MKTIEQVKKYIRGLPLSKPFSKAELLRFGTPENIRKILSRLVQVGEIKRVTHGIFVKPGKSAYLHATLPSPQEVVQAIAKKTGEIITIHGAEAARQLHLTTQVPLQAVFYTSGSSRIIHIGKRPIKLQHISSRKLVSPGTMKGTVILALWYLGHGKVSEKTIQTVKGQLSEEEFNNLLEEIPKMPAWMAKQFYLCIHKNEKSND